MEEDNNLSPEEGQRQSRWRPTSPEIVEIGDDGNSMIRSRDGCETDVYIAVGKNDLDVVKWVLDNAVSAGSRVFLVHIFPTITYIPTPVGKLSRSQLSQEQVQVYINEENNRRRNQLQKYIRLCIDVKVAVETMLVESNATTKAILELIPVANITQLFMGTKRTPFSRASAIQGCHCLNFRRSRWGLGKGEYVQKNAPDYCEVTIIQDGKKITVDQQKPAKEDTSSVQGPSNAQHSERNFFECTCFSGKFK